MKIIVTTRFEKDLKKLKRSAPGIEAETNAVIILIAGGKPLPAGCRDHKLKGMADEKRDCHIRPDIVLVYQKTAGALTLYRIGSHSDLFKR